MKTTYLVSVALSNSSPACLQQLNKLMGAKGYSQYLETDEGIHLMPPGHYWFESYAPSAPLMVRHEIESILVDMGEATHASIFVVETNAFAFALPMISSTAALNLYQKRKHGIFGTFDDLDDCAPVPGSDGGFRDGQHINMQFSVR